jgi:hypothetical protein
MDWVGYPAEGLLQASLKGSAFEPTASRFFGLFRFLMKLFPKKLPAKRAIYH